jgi:transcriptional regulator with XRE-family HTH domain
MSVEYPNILKELREKRNITPTEIAVEIGVSHSTVYKWESGITFPKNSRIMVPLIEKAYHANKEEIWSTVY